MKKIKWVIVLLVVIALISVVYMMSQNAKYEKLAEQEMTERLSRDEVNKNKETEQSVREKEDIKFAEESANEQALWLKRTRVEMKDTTVNGRFVIAPLGISLDSKILPEGTAYSYYWNTVTNPEVRFEVKDLDTAQDDLCFGFIRIIKTASESDKNPDEMYPLSRLEKASSDKEGVKKIGLNTFAVYVSPQDGCSAQGQYFDEKTDTYKLGVNGQKIIDMRKMFENSIPTAELIK